MVSHRKKQEIKTMTSTEYGGTTKIQKNKALRKS